MFRILKIPNLSKDDSHDNPLIEMIDRMFYPCLSQYVCLPIWFNLESRFYSGWGGLLRLGVLVEDPLPLMDAGTHLGCRHSGQMAIHKMQNMMRYSVVIPRAFCGVFVFASRASLVPQPNCFWKSYGGPVYSRVDAAKGNFVFVKILGRRSRHHCRLIVVSYILVEFYK